MTGLNSGPCRGAHTSRVLATVFHRRELSLQLPVLMPSTLQEKFVALEQRDQHTRRVRYPEVRATRP